MSAKKNTKVKAKVIQQPSSYVKVFAFILVFITTIVYYKSLNNELTRWDDDKYITENELVRSFRDHSLSPPLHNVFTEYVMGNYHPLTMLSFGLEYKKFELNPKPYHVTNLILHLLNTLLVLAFIMLLTNKQWIAFITALLFAIHPMHVESVAWVAERKDVLYAFFYLASICCYLLFLKKENKKVVYYSVAFLLFILAVLSKGMAVSLPIAFFAIDYYLDRKITSQTIIEKIPFLILALIFGYVAIDAQNSAKALDLTHYNYFERILFTGYGLLIYLWKVILPIKLSCFYGYPTKKEGVYPLFVYIAPIVVLTIGILVFRIKQFKKEIYFGCLFFLISIGLVLQLLPVGLAVVAERYTYLPYIGLFFIAAYFINAVIENEIVKNEKIKNTILIGFTSLVIVYSIAAAKRSLIWHDSLVLWNNAIEETKQADETFIAYYCRGQAYHRIQQYDKAVADFDYALSLKKDYPDAYYDRGYANDALGKYDQAIRDYTSAIKLKSDFADAYCNRGNAYYNLKDYEKALSDYNNAIKYNPKLPGVYSNRAVCNYIFKKYDVALKDAIKAKELGFTENQQLFDFLLKINNEKKQHVITP